MSRTIAMVNRKGGSGKTVTAFNVAGALTQAGHSVLVIDLDPQGSLTKGLGMAPGNPTLSEVLLGGGEGFTELIQETHISGLHAIPSEPGLNAIETGLREVPGRELRLRRCMNKFLHRDFHYILVDCPPSLGSLTQNALVAVRDVLIPLDCGTYGRDALGTTLDVIDFIKEEINYNLRILGVLISNVKTNTNFDTMAEAAIREQFGDLVFQTVIPNSIKVDEASEARMPLVYYMKKFHISDLYRALVGEIEARE